MKYIYSDKLTDDCKYIRETVFCKEQGFKEEFDTTDNNCHFIIAYDNEKPIATGRVFNETENIWHIGRVAVLKEYRGKNIGKKIIEQLENQAKRLGAKQIVLSSQIQVKGFYATSGYHTIGDIYSEEDYPHIKMIKELDSEVKK